MKRRLLNQQNHRIRNTKIAKQTARENSSRDNSGLYFLNELEITKNLNIKGVKKNDLYMAVICKLFNLYIQEVKTDINKFEFAIPKFLRLASMVIT